MFSQSIKVRRHPLAGRLTSPNKSSGDDLQQRRLSHHCTQLPPRDRGPSAGRALVRPISRASVMAPAGRVGINAHLLYTGEGYRAAGTSRYLIGLLTELAKT